jgi:hypothetical protein
MASKSERAFELRYAEDLAKACTAWSVGRRGGSAPWVGGGLAQGYGVA